MELWAEIAEQYPVFWYASIGLVASCFGSFLNVVIYRMPRGMNLSQPGSHCPKCHHPIRWWHNLPILGWLLLRGRCYDCRAPIAARYPIVEFIVAATWVALAWLVNSHWQLSVKQTVDDTLVPGQLLTTWHWQGCAVGLWLSGCVAATCMIALAYIAWDRQRLANPTTIVAGFGFGIGLLFLEQLPALRNALLVIINTIVTTGP